MDDHAADQSENDAAIISSLLYLMDSNTEQRSNYSEEITGGARTTELQDSSIVRKDDLFSKYGSSIDFSWSKHERQV